MWWRCEIGHEWKAWVANRSRLGRGCPYCAGKLVLAETSLTALRPDVAAQWHPTRNGSLMPDAVAMGTSTKVWWQCDKGHEWKVSVNNRTSSNTGCPYCSGKRAAPETSLTRLRPDLAAEWHPALNGALTPNDVTVGSNKHAWWRCGTCSHAWKSSIANRSKGRGCPRCNYGWSAEVIRATVASLGDHLVTLSPAERYAVFLASGAVGSTRAKLIRELIATGKLPAEARRRGATDAGRGRG